MTFAILFRRGRWLVLTEKLWWVVLPWGLASWRDVWLIVCVVVPFVGNAELDMFGRSTYAAIGSLPLPIQRE